MTGGLFNLRDDSGTQPHGVQREIFFLSDVFDLFGDPVPEGHGRRWCPQHIATLRNYNKFMMLLAFGWNNERIASSLGIAPPTLRKNYFRKLNFYDAATKNVADNSMAGMIHCDSFLDLFGQTDYDCNESKRNRLESLSAELNRG